VIVGFSGLSMLQAHGFFLIYFRGSQGSLCIIFSLHNPCNSNDVFMITRRNFGPHMQGRSQDLDWCVCVEGEGSSSVYIKVYGSTIKSDVGLKYYRL
jgi:hypothetical protein